MLREKYFTPQIILQILLVLEIGNIIFITSLALMMLKSYIVLTKLLVE
jgi:hypothetical protein